MCSRHLTIDVILGLCCIFRCLTSVVTVQNNTESGRRHGLPPLYLYTHQGMSRAIIGTYLLMRMSEVMEAYRTESVWKRRHLYHLNLVESFVFFMAMIQVVVSWVVTPCGVVVGHRSREQGPPKRRYPTTSLYSVTIQKTTTLISLFRRKLNNPSSSVEVIDVCKTVGNNLMRIKCSSALYCAPERSQGNKASFCMWYVTYNGANTTGMINSFFNRVLLAK
jgi:hypothetical protein